MLYQPPPKRRDHHPVLRGRLASSVSTVSMAGSGAGAAGTAGGAGTDGGALAPCEIGAGSRTVERRRGASGSGADTGVSAIIGAGGGGGGAASRSATAARVSGSTPAGAEDSSPGAKPCSGAGAP